MDPRLRDIIDGMLMALFLLNGVTALVCFLVLVVYAIYNTLTPIGVGAVSALLIESAVAAFLIYQIGRGTDSL